MDLLISFNFILNINFINHSSRAHKSALLPMPLVYFPRFVNKFTVALTFTFYPLSDIVVTIRVNKSTITIVGIILEHTLINDMIDFFTNTIHFSIWSKLSYNVSIVLTLAELHRLINKFG